MARATLASQRCCCAAALLLVLAGGCGGEDPALAISPPAVDFGRVIRGEVRDVRFVLRNTSSHEVRILPRPNCACFSVGHLPRGVLAPGEALDLHLRFDSSILPPGQMHGKKLVVYTGEGGPPLEVALQGEVIRHVVVEPPLLDVGKVQAGMDSTWQVTLTPAHGQGIDLAGVSVTPRGLFEVTHRPGEGLGLVLEVRLGENARLPPGEFLAEIALDLSLAPAAGEDPPTAEKARVFVRGIGPLTGSDRAPEQKE